MNIFQIFDTCCQLPSENLYQFIVLSTVQINLNLDFQATRNYTTIIINLILTTAKKLKMNTTLVIP